MEPLFNLQGGWLLHWGVSNAGDCLIIITFYHFLEDDLTFISDYQKEHFQEVT
jgi:hypothetical protein